MRSRILVYFLIALSILFASPQTIAKANGKIIIDCEGDSQAVSQLVTSFNRILVGFADNKDSLLILDNEVLLNAGNEVEINRITDELLVEISSFVGDLGIGDKNKISNTILDMKSTTDQVVKLLEKDVSKELRDATGRFAVIYKKINPALGFMVIAIFVFFSVSLLLDIAYLIIPLFRLVIEGKKEGVKPKFVTKEAYRALLESEEEGNKTAILLIYAKKQVIPVAIWSICMGYFLRGRIFELVGKIIDLFSGFIS